MSTPKTATGIRRKAAGVGKRGPLKGFKTQALIDEKAAQAVARRVAKAIKADREQRVTDAIDVLGNLALCVREARELPSLLAASAALANMSAFDRENPTKLSGDALRAHAHRRGLSKSELVGMPDEKIRTQLRYITQQQYETAE